MRNVLVLIFLSASKLAASAYDVIIYGGTSAAVIAAVQVKKMGHTVLLVSPDRQSWRSQL
jgi:hypothetical protein